MSKEKRKGESRLRSIHSVSYPGRLELKKTRNAAALTTSQTAAKIRFRLQTLEVLKINPPAGKTADDVQESIDYWNHRLQQVDSKK